MKTLFQCLAISFFVSSLCACGGSSSEPGPSNGNDQPNSAPIALELAFIDTNGGSANLGDTLTLSYRYTDADGDAEGSSQIRWFRNGEAIEGAQSRNYELQQDDIPTNIYAEVTPVASTGTKQGAVTRTATLATGGQHYYIDPEAGNDSNDGSKLAPWKTIQHLFEQDKIQSQQWDGLPYTEQSVLVPRNEGAQIKPGDVIWLTSGHYGELAINGHYNQRPIYLIAADKQRPIFSQIRIRASSHWTISGVTVKSDPDVEVTGLALLESHSYHGPISHIQMRHSELLSVEDSSNWDASDWVANARSGFKVNGTNMTINNNRLTNVRHGMDISATHSLIEHNRITNFSGDGMRSIGANYTTFQYNTIENCFDVDENHDDGFQNFAFGPDGTVATGVTTGVVVRGNVVRNFTDPEQPLRGPLQGIASFDGTIEGWLVEGNEVIVDNWHGISLYGAQDTTVRNNIISDPDGAESVGPGSIRIYPSKTDIPSNNVLVECNITPQVSIPADQGQITTRYNTFTNQGAPWDSNCISK